MEWFNFITPRINVYPVQWFNYPTISTYSSHRDNSFIPFRSFHFLFSLDFFIFFYFFFFLLFQVIRASVRRLIIIHSFQGNQIFYLMYISIIDILSLFVEVLSFFICDSAIVCPYTPDFQPIRFFRTQIGSLK